MQENQGDGPSSHRSAFVVARKSNNQLAGGVVLTICAVATLEVHQQRQQTEQDLQGAAKAVADFVIGVTSVWMVVPALVAFATPPQLLSNLGPETLLLRRAVILLSLPSCLSSLAAWYSWNTATGLCDEVLATSLIWGFMLLGLLRGGWASSYTHGFFCATTVLVMAEQFLNRYQPWPHLAFRLTALCSGLTGLNAGLLIATPLQFFCVLLVLVFISIGHISLELWLADCVGDACAHLSEPGPYLGGVARTGAAALVFLLVTFALLCRKLGSGSGSSSESATDGESGSESECSPQSGADWPESVTKHTPGPNSTSVADYALGVPSAELRGHLCKLLT
mmetsp:Transcript_100322/g.321696  ORF Transcript_100322/g.321696 Transcript_100322/m.321696 type:complete len:337 (-) Transcript_100322:198-1208(-)